MNLYDTWLTKTPIAHRGLHGGNSEENSLSSFEKAISQGFAIEMDLQMTADGVVMVFHDDTLKRMTGLEGDIRETNYDVIKNAKLGESEEHIPTFDEFLNMVKGRTPLLIEVKSHKNVGIMEQKIAHALAGYKGDIALQSFNPFIVEWFAKNTPQYIRGQLSSHFRDSDLPFYQKILLRNLAFIRRNRSQFISYDAEDIDKPLIKRMIKRMPVLAWTVRSEEQYQSIKHCCNNIIFENYIPTP